MDEKQKGASLALLSRATGLSEGHFRYSDDYECFQRVLPTKPGIMQGQPFYWVCNKSEGSDLLGARNDVVWICRDPDTGLDVYSNEELKAT